jgi:hypothetical protein
MNGVVHAWVGQKLLNCYIFKSFYSYINLIGVINVFVYYGPPPTTMDAVLATMVAGGRAQFQ